MRDDRPLSVKGWRPENYTREYLGNVSLSQALATSLNTVSVRLTLEFGPIAVAKTAHRLGIASKLEPNASIGLGTSEVSVVELVSAYAAFANGGLAVAPHVVERVRTAGGSVLYRRTADNLGRVIDGRYVAMMNHMMRETLLTGTARKADLPGWPAAGKTGTSQDFRDAWFIGYTAQYVTGVWLGNDDGSPTHKTSGSGLPVEIWSRVMKTAHQNVPVAGLPGLSGGVPLAVALPPGEVPRRPQLVDAERKDAGTGFGCRRNGQLAARKTVRQALTACDFNQTRPAWSCLSASRNDADRCHARRARPLPASLPETAAPEAARSGLSGSSRADAPLHAPPDSPAHRAGRRSAARNRTRRRRWSRSPSGLIDRAR